LVTETFATTCWHDTQCVVPRQDRFHDLPLAGSETGEAKDLKPLVEVLQRETRAK
jgi:hypothetical protein